MASTAWIDFGIGRILTVLENEALSLTRVSGEVEKIRKELMVMKSFLGDTDIHGGTGSASQVFQTFVANTRDLAYQVEDIIDEFAYHISRYRGCTSRLQRVIHFPRYIWARRSIASKLEQVNVMIHAISDSVKRYNCSESFRGALPVDDSNSNRVRNLRVSSLFFSHDSLVGIDEAREKLVGWLLNLLETQPQRTVVSVVGMGGSGKTTLVANIFKSEIIRRHFDSYAWVTISQSYVIEDVFRAMIKEFYKEADTQIPAELYSMSYRELVEMLVNYLQQKRYIVVLDDVWSTGLWREISVGLPDGIHGSRVMITTRNETVAFFSYGTERQIHRIEPLNKDDAWSLFCNKAFSGNPEQHSGPNVESTARDLLQRCEGLPLAIVALGSMMLTKRLESEWKRVRKTLNWELGNNPELKVVRSILLLSFNDLPYPLKRCFLYCCLFPENYRIKRKKLIRMWMAQGFVEPVRGAKLEEVADNYLMELTCRNLLQVILRNHSGRPKACKMHDVIREIALSISKTERFCDVYDDEGEGIRDNGARHLCIRRETILGSTQPNLHSLLVHSAAKQKIRLPPGLKLLRVLDLEDSPINKLPGSLVTLFNLKYLNLTRTQVEELPKSFHRLINLETLNTKHSRIEALPQEISKLQNLRYLITFRHNYGHDSNWNYVLGTKASSDIWQLKNLQVIDCINAEAELIKKLGNMKQLTRISLVRVRKDHGEDLCNSLNKIKDLRFLALTSIDEEEPLQIDALSSATSIEKLFLAGKLERLPSWFRSLRNLAYLGLRCSRLEADAITHIQALPNLVWLSFYDAYQGNRLCFPEGFQNLKILEIVHAPHLTEIVIQNGAMSGLQKLYIRACRGINSVPDGIEGLIHLQELHLALVSDQLVERIRGEQSIDRSKVKHIPDIKHYFRTESGSFYESLS